MWYLWTWKSSSPIPFSNHVTEMWGWGLWEECPKKVKKTATIMQLKPHPFYDLNERGRTSVTKNTYRVLWLRLFPFYLNHKKEQGSSHKALSPLPPSSEFRAGENFVANPWNHFILPELGTSEKVAWLPSLFPGLCALVSFFMCPRNWKQVGTMLLQTQHLVNQNYFINIILGHLCALPSKQSKHISIDWGGLLAAHSVMVLLCIF